MHGFDGIRRTVLVGLFAGMLLASFLPVAMSTSAYAQSSSSQVTINGAGATFPFPLIDTWRVEYKKVNPSISLNYQSIGSGGGIKQFTERTVDFGASDAPLTAAQTKALPGAAVHIPETIGSVVAAYNIPGFKQKGLLLTGPILADIYLGKITRWDDPAIKALNPKVPLPSKDILVVRRSDGSGTTFVWTDYLSSVSPEWAQKVGKGTAVQWPKGRGAPGNEGVASTVRGAPYSLGYVELAYALTANMNYAFIQNKEGNFIEPSLDSAKAAVEASATALPAGDAAWTNVSLVNAPGDSSYPIASFSYLLLYKEMSTSTKIDSEAKAKAIVDFIAWAISPAGQQHAQKLSYVPLPDNVVSLNQKTLASLTYKGKALYTMPGSSSSSTATSTTTATTEEPASKTYTAKLSVTASMSKTTKMMNLVLRNPSNSDAQVYQLQVTLDGGANVMSAKGPAGWAVDYDGDTVIFTTDDKPITKGKLGLFKITASATASSIDWESDDADGNVINAKTTTVSVR
ncbi:phosphate ABC transporter substrate-binding protein PstS [Nitrososphaera viennensis]|uniref:ABC phosphate uptake transporter, substrate-binding protein n=2 Tax=Nitrososphaera viennensis TaxID=1034015 RepID=A0A060HLH9_9ARCH|nr:phosphate ABC transporter substrate-binding protein PstS [Nitrososphaera viennensis]AIC16348.1 ABC phosphate uptake transporter, substrate-binding protein [Nitrososphaera viennensis EN76]UVS68284.1 phosphate ABC transporter substrate-binding protein PstS [Nitrososphaera viennensis]